VRPARLEALPQVPPIDVVLSDDTIVQPDLFYVSKQRRGIVGKRVDGPLDLAIEIISESHATRDRTHQVALYARYGVAEYWTIDPAEQHIEFLLLDGGRYRVQPPSSSTFQSPRLPEIAIELASFWADVAKLAAN